MKEKLNISNSFLAILGVFVVVILGLTIRQNKAAIHAGLDKLNLIPKAEHFTELYFMDHTSLPKQIALGKPISFAFVIHNVEGTDMEYPYVIYFKSQDGSIVNIEESAVQLKDGASKTVPVNYTSTLPVNQGKIFVELEQLQQVIQFSVSNAN